MRSPQVSVDFPDSYLGIDWEGASGALGEVYDQLEVVGYDPQHKAFCMDCTDGLVFSFAI